MRMLSLPELRSRKGIPYSREHIRRLVNACLFPKPVKLGQRQNARVAWFEQEVDQWLADRMAERDKTQKVAA
jgi:prophage regulatory protein